MKNDPKFPNWAKRVVRRLCGDWWAEGIQGDLHENYRRRHKTIGPAKAWILLVLELTVLLRFLFYEKEGQPQNRNIMIKEYFKIGFRVLNRNRTYSLINLSGLATGIACTLLIWLWVNDELKFDRFHENIENLYCIEFDQGNPYTFDGTPAELAPVAKNLFDEVKGISRYRSYSGLIMQNGNQVFHEDNGAVADNDFFNMFSFSFISGDSSKALSDPYSVVITKSFSKKYFGSENPLGRTITLNNQYNLTVTGLIEDVQANSSLQFDYIFPVELTKVAGWYEKHWGSVWLKTYVLLRDNTNNVHLGEKILASVLRGADERWGEEFIQALVFNPLKTKRLNDYSYTGSGFVQKNRQSIYIFSGLGILILLIACINFINLSTARSARRAKEIGMRKVIGAIKMNIRTQFLGESFLQTCFALILALSLVSVLIGPFNHLSGKDIAPQELLESQFLFAVPVVLFVVTIISGSYPAFYLSGLQPVKVLKGNLSSGSGNSSLRKALVIIQFGLSVFLVIGTLVIRYQMDYVSNKELGYDKQNVLYIPLLHENTQTAFQTLKHEWLKQPEIISVSGTQANPANIGYSSYASWKGKVTHLIRETALESHT